MNLLGLTSACFCLLATAPNPTTGNPTPGNPTPGNPEKDIVATASAAGVFKTLLAAVKTAGLEDVLRQQGPFTVFAPTDEAFEKLPKGTIGSLLDPANRATLTAILQFHVVAGKVDAATALRRGTVKNLANSTLKIVLQGGRLRVEDANVIQNDVGSRNGIIHIIDSVLLPPMSKTKVPIELTPASLIKTAIQRGVPLFNQGQQAACAAIYEITVRGLLQLNTVPAKDREDLATALRKSATQSPTDAAWTLRRALDSAHESLNASDHSDSSDATPAPQAEPRALRKRAIVANTIFEFNDAAEAGLFRALNDTVMGGRSNSRMEAGAETAVFTGTTSLENRGGFASVRAPIVPGSLAGATAIGLRVRGDGRTYRLTVQQNRAMYDIEFPTAAGKWIEVDLPFSKLRRNIRGYRPNTKPPKPGDVSGIGILIGDKKAGPFRLEIDWIRKQG
jgi:uncharacterized surface protein with fasciclin (FAS1) repeats